MPLFDYTCRECKHTFETLVNAGDTVRCPECNSKRVDRELSLPAAPVVKSANTCGSGPPCGAMGCGRLK